ncbi:MAG: amidohydrolase family protein [Acidimicrobiia bacterium]
MSPATKTRNYTLISSDTHAGGSHEEYREFLDPAYRDTFDEWRGRYKNPWKDLRDTDLRTRNWNDARRDADQQTDGVVAEALYPNTVPPFYPGFVLFAGPPKPDEYELRRAGIKAHNRWLVDFCGRRPHQRAGIGQFFLNDIDDAIADITWIAEQGLRGGVLLPTVAPDVTWVKPLYDPEYDRLWAAIQDLDVIVNLHTGTGSPNYGRYPAVPQIMVVETHFYGWRPLIHMMLSGVFERFPRLKFVLAEASASALIPQLEHMDAVMESVRRGAIGELKYRPEDALPGSATEYFHRNCWLAASLPTLADPEARKALPPDRYMWGNDYPHDEGTVPFTKQNLRQIFHSTPEAELRGILGENAAKLYGFDLDVLAPLADRYGPSVEELATPLLELPENPNSAILKGAGLRKTS